MLLCSMRYVTIEKFQEMTDRHGVPKLVASQVHKELVAHYSESDRHYHNLERINRMLGIHSRVCPLDDEVGLAIWFHDVIYDPKMNHNERKSAHYFSDKLSPFLWGEFVGEVQRLIVATDPMLKHRGTNRENLMIDIDLSVLGSPLGQYREHASLLRLEYSHVDEEEYRERRSNYLRALLSDKIFTTEHFYPLEEQAQANIKQELEEMQEAGLHI